MSRRAVLLGLNENHDASVALWVQGQQPTALATERLTRTKHDESGILRTALFLLRKAGIDEREVSHVVRCPSPVAISRSLLAERTRRLRTNFPNAQMVHAARHHELHARAAVHMAPGEPAVALVVDGMGSIVASEPHTQYEAASVFDVPSYTRTYLATTTRFPYDWPRENIGLGRLYSYVTKHIFTSRYDAGKTMALASFGDPDRYPSFLDWDTSGSHPAPIVRGSRLRILDSIPRADEPLHLADLAARVQRDIEIGMLALARIARQSSSADRLFVSGGVALNCPANMGILESELFKEVYFHPASTDDGIAIGCLAYAAELLKLDLPPLRSPFLGPVTPSVGGPTEHASIKVILDLLLHGKIIALFEGGAEFGPRALGHRSILALPNHVSQRDRINSGIKGRELFRPLAPAILRDRVSEYFDVPSGFDNSHMLLVARALPLTVDLAPACVHVDGTARVQTVERHSTLILAQLLTGLEAEGFAPILLNTSLNGPGEPILETAEDAIGFILRSELDAGLVNGRLICK